MTLKRRLLAQFKRPHGLLGHIAGWILARRPSNVLRNRWTVDIVNPEAGMRVLEVGCGPGVALHMCLARDGVSAMGVDHSALMISHARRRNAASVRQGRLVLAEGSIEDVSADSPGFDKIFSVNVIQFVDADKFVQRAACLLKPGGLLAATYQPRHARATPADAMRMATRLQSAFSRAGLINIRIEELPLKPMPAVCVLGQLDARRSVT